MKKALIQISIIICSTAWIFTAGLSLYFYLRFWRINVWPFLLIKKPQTDFPFLDYAMITTTITCAWLGIVVIFWTWRLTKKFSFK